jgi:peptidoglycan-associated lipoprotein
MRKSLLVILLAIAALALWNCGGPKPVAEEATTTTPTTTEKPVTQTETPKEEPKAPLSEAQFQTVYFDFDKANLRPDARAALDHNYELLKEYASAVIKIEGHCDERGTVEYNLSLGERRARAAMDYLSGLGVAGSRISVISYGKERPAVPGSNEDAWAKNRRCEFRVVSQ